MDGNVDGIDVESLVVPAALLPAFGAGAIDQDPAHCFGCGCEKVAATVPAGLGVAQKSQIGFVNEGGGLQCLPWLLMSQLCRRELAKFVVNERQQLVGGRWIAGLNSLQNLRDVHIDHDRRL